jgi:hypothetical protein
MRRVRFRQSQRRLALATALAVVMLGFTFGGTPASALNHDSFNILKNAGRHQYCLDIRAEDPPYGARAHLWTCTHPVVGEQLFLLVTDRFGFDQIKVGNNFFQTPELCLEVNVGGGPAIVEPCDFGNPNLQSWDLRDTGEIVSRETGRCLDATPADTKDADVVDRPCNGTISQRWLF